MKVKRAGIGTKILVLVLLVAAVTALLSMRTQLKTARERRDLLSQQVQQQLEANAALADATLKVEAVSDGIGSLTEQFAAQLEDAKIKLQEAVASMYAIRPEED